MAMNNRLLRPRASGFHPEAAAWKTAVVANGGSVSGATLSAVDKFCKAIDAAGIRDRLYRVNLFAGTGLNACLVPLYRNWKVYAGRNLQLYGDSLALSNWTKSGCTATASSSERPFSYGPFANAVTATAGTGATPHLATSASNFGYGTVTVSAYLKANGQNTVRVLLVGSSGMTFPGGGTVAYANINLSNGAVSNVLAGTSATATSIGNGWYRFAYTCANSGTGNMTIRYDVGSGSAYNPNGSESFFLWGVQSEVGSTATEYDPYPLGGLTDTNNNFVSGDYAETGASGGLTGNGTTKYIDTGLAVDAMPTFSTGHVAAYKASGSGSNRQLIGARNAAETQYIRLFKQGTSDNDTVWGSDVVASSATNKDDSGFLLGARTSATVLRLFFKGSQVNEQTASATTTAFNRKIFVFADNQGSAALFWSLGIRGYSIGGGLTDAQVASYTDAMNTLQSSLGRA